MDAILHDWPYLGLVLAAASLLWLLRAPRPRDPAWVVCFLAPMYMVHQFEEHGIDLLGRHYEFLPELCRTLGFPTTDGCPGDPGFIFAVNVFGCWTTFALPFIYGQKKPLVAACAWGVAIVNAVTHIASGILHGAYNPGLATSLVLFLPLSAWMLVTVVRAGVVKKTQVPLIIVSGVLMHAVLLGSLLLRERGLPYPVFFAVNVLNGLMPLAVVRVALARGGRADILGA